MPKPTKNIVSILLGIFCFGMQSLFAQNPIPAKAQDKAIVLTNATIHIGNGQVLTNADLRFEKGIITAVGTGIDKSGAEEINLSGQHIYPGLILPCTSLGLTEIGAVRPTNDYAETGEYNPNARSLISYYTDSEIIPTVRSNGVLLAQPTPRGGIIAGTSSVMELDGWNWEDAVHKVDMGLHLNWIPQFTRGGFFSPNPGQLQKNEKRVEQLQELENFFAQALAYSQNANPDTKNLKFEAMRGLFDGTKTLFIRVNFSREIIESVQFAQKNQVKKIVINGGENALEVADFLKENNIPVILARVHRLPYNDEEDVWMPYKLPALLSKAGVLVALAYDAQDNEPMGTRNLPFLAGTAAAYGLSKEEALMTVTSNTAKILGIDNKVGTLEKGKQATLVVSSGDLLDMRGNNVVHAFIQGKKLDLTDKHKHLYKVFKDKYEGN